MKGPSRGDVDQDPLQKDAQKGGLYSFVTLGASEIRAIRHAGSLLGLRLTLGSLQGSFSLPCVGCISYSSDQVAGGIQPYRICHASTSQRLCELFGALVPTSLRALINTSKVLNSGGEPSRGLGFRAIRIYGLASLC